MYFKYYYFLLYYICVYLFIVLYYICIYLTILDHVLYDHIYKIIILIIYNYLSKFCSLMIHSQSLVLVIQISCTNDSLMENYEYTQSTLQTLAPQWLSRKHPLVNHTWLILKLHNNTLLPHLNTHLYN